MKTPAFFFLKIIWLFRVLNFYTNFRIICSILWKCLWYFDKDCIEFVDCLGLYGHFNNINSSNLWAFCILPSVCVIFNFFQWCHSFPSAGLLFPWLDLFLGILFFLMQSLIGLFSKFLFLIICCYYIEMQQISLY